MTTLDRPGALAGLSVSLSRGSRSLARYGSLNAPRNIRVLLAAHLLVRR